MISIVGDLSFNGLISDDPSNNHWRFNDIAPILGASDYVIANLEVPVKNGEHFNEYKKLIHYSLPQPTRDLLKMLNIRCVSLANNHVYDCKMSGVTETIGILDDLGIYHTGAGWKREHVEPVIFNYRGASIGFLAYVDKSTNPHTAYFPELLINYLSLERVRQDITDLKGRVDKVICSIHWGKDYSNFYSGEQEAMAHQMIEIGVDMIVGHHSHTIQPYELYQNKPVFYGLGQICFGDFSWEGNQRALRRKTKLGMIVRFTDVKLNAFDIIPTREQKGNRIIIDRKNLRKKLHRLRWINRMKNRYSLVGNMVRFKESYLDRIYEYFFGYYRRPLMDLRGNNNLKKMKYMPRDFNSYKQ